MDEYTSKVRVWELLCPGLPEEVGRARRWTRDVLTHQPAAEDAALIVTELGTNAVTHTASPDFRVTIHHAGATITLTVTDQGGTRHSPHLTHPDDDATSGRGLAIVSLLATDFRVTSTTNGHTITAQLPNLSPEATTC